MGKIGVIKLQIWCFCLISPLKLLFLQTIAFIKLTFAIYDHRKQSLNFSFMLMHKPPHCLLNFHFFSQHGMFFITFLMNF